jgi:hypothetical protein
VPLQLAPVIGQIKGRGFRRFSLRGLVGVKGEFTLVCVVHNLLKLWRAGMGWLRGSPAHDRLAYA